MSIELHWAQKEASLAIGDLLQAGEKKIYVDMPTRTGKTGVFLGILEQFALQGILPPTTIVTDRKELRRNILKDAQLFAPTLFNNGLIQGHTAKTLRVSESMPLVRVMTYAGRTRAVKQGIIRPENEQLLIEDEAQHALSELRLLTHNINPNAIHLAFTASPEYSREKGLPQAGYKQAYHLTRQRAIDGDLNSHTRSIIVEMQNVLGNLDDIRMTGGDFSPDELEKIVRQTEVMENIGNFMEYWSSPVDARPVFTRSGFIYCNSIADAIGTAQYLNNRFGDNTCEAAWGAMDPNQQRDVIDSHETGKVRFLASADFAVEGLGNASHDVVINKTPSKSAVRVKQRGGRITEFDPDNPDKEALIADFIYPSERGEQLTFGDAIGGYLFEKSHTSKTSGPSNGTPVLKPPVLIDGLKIHAQPETIETFAHARARRRTEAETKHLNVFREPIKMAMIRQRYFSFESVWGDVQKFIEANPPQNPEQLKICKKSTIKRLMTGEASFEDKKYNAYNYGAVALASVLGVHAQQLFGPLKGLDKEGEEKKFPPFVPVDDADMTTPEETAMAITNLFDAVTMAEYAYLTEGEDYALDTAAAEEHEVALHMADQQYPGLSEIHPTMVSQNTTVEDEVYKRQLYSKLSRKLEMLSPRMEYVLRASFGISINPERSTEQTNEEIGQKFSVTRERVRGMKADAFEHLRSPTINSAILLDPDQTKASEYAFSVRVENQRRLSREFEEQKKEDPKLFNRGRRDASNANAGGVLRALKRIAQGNHLENPHNCYFDQGVFQLFSGGYTWHCEDRMSFIASRIRGLRPNEGHLKRGLSESWEETNNLKELCVDYKDKKQGQTAKEVDLKKFLMQEMKIIETMSPEDLLASMERIADKDNHPCFEILDQAVLDYLSEGYDWSIEDVVKIRRGELFDAIDRWQRSYLEKSLHIAQRVASIIKQHQEELKNIEVEQPAAEEPKAKKPYVSIFDMK